MLNFRYLARLEVPEKFVWGVGGVVCTVIFMSNPTVVLCCVRVGVGVLTIKKFVLAIIFILKSSSILDLSGGERVPPSPLGWYLGLFSLISFYFISLYLVSFYFIRKSRSDPPPPHRSFTHLYHVS